MGLQGRVSSADAPAVARSVLICDDKEAMRLLVNRTLTQEGYAVVEATTASEAYALACAEHPDLIILDVMLTDESGLDLLSRLRSVPALEQTPVVLVTGAAEAFDGVVPQTLGADRCLIKPVLPTALSSTVHELLRTH
jgi:DNA-binding response OmpR family regulator